jgi:hypothetical protein
MEVIVDGWPKEGKDQVLLEEVTCKYVQENDCTENRDDVQEITISSRDGGGGKFINFKTESWSITGDNFEEELLPLFKDFKKRISKL